MKIILFFKLEILLENSAFKDKLELNDKEIRSLKEDNDQLQIHIENLRRHLEEEYRQNNNFKKQTVLYIQLKLNFFN